MVIGPRWKRVLAK